MQRPQMPDLCMGGRQGKHGSQESNGQKRGKYSRRQRSTTLQIQGILGQETKRRPCPAKGCALRPKRPQTTDHKGQWLARSQKIPSAFKWDLHERRSTHGSQRPSFLGHRKNRGPEISKHDSGLHIPPTIQLPQNNSTEKSTEKEFPYPQPLMHLCTRSS